MEKVMEEIISCKKCKLSKLDVNSPNNRKILLDINNFVKGKKVVVIAQNPSYWRNKDEKPVLSSSKKRVDVLFINTMKLLGIQRDEIYATNIVKCSTIENKKIDAEYIEKCKDFIFKEINFVSPKIIITLGSFAADFFKLKFGQLKTFNNLFVSAKIFAARHPSYALRRGLSSKEYLNEFLKLKEVIKDE